MGSFPAIFAQPLALGTLSRRRVAHEAQRLLSHVGRPGAGSLRSVARAQSAIWSMQETTVQVKPVGLRDSHTSSILNWTLIPIKSMQIVKETI